MTGAQFDVTSGYMLLLTYNKVTQISNFCLQFNVH